MAEGSESRNRPVRKSEASNFRSMIWTMGATDLSLSCQAKSPHNNQQKSTASPPAVYARVPTCHRRGTPV